MAIFKIYDCEFGVKANSINYTFEHVDGLTIEDPESVRLIRGSNAANKVGLAYTEGTKDAKKIAVTLVGISTAMYDLLASLHADKTRVECYCIDKKTGSSKIAKDAIITQRPQQLSIVEGADSLNIMVNFESFNLEESHKD